jgi:UDP-N-acetylglucosamine diphosphorylase / glucose-1-phosphate thymidylyltransferase / UDP-N-acetylgalactosamine diphosphorylase / glucosamine-1-phosphate N-acetyltransferase / galactosamine-1-phosphate N-acetyltransferase
MAVTGTTVPETQPASEEASAPSLLPALFADLPSPWAERFDPLAPWALLGEPLDEVLAALPSEHIDAALAAEVHLAGDRIVIGRGTRVHPNVVIEGPCWIGEDVEIRPGAYIRGGVWIGDGCVVGASTEVKCAILLPHAKAPHLNYVGDSILGAGVNLGAGTVLSNFRHDGREVRIPVGDHLAGENPGPLPTGRRKLGAVLGDGVLTGCNCVLHPGVVVGRGTHIYPGVQLRPGVYPENSVVKLVQDIAVVPRRGK